jgi:putative protein-disulfide isomerase
MDLHYIFDPLCGWCYGAASLTRTLSVRLGPLVSLRLWPGALFPEPVQVEAAMRSHIVSSDRRIQELTGAQFGPAYVARMGSRSTPVMLWSVPVIAALAAMPRKGQLDFLEALQRAHYVEGRDLADMGTLLQLAGAAGLETRAFAVTMQSPAHAQATKAWIAAARALMARSGVDGFPGYVLEQGGRLTRLDHNSAYRYPEALIEQIDARRH